MDILDEYPLTKPTPTNELTEIKLILLLLTEYSEKLLKIYQLKKRARRKILGFYLPPSRKEQLRILEKLEGMIRNQLKKVIESIHTIDYTQVNRIEDFAVKLKISEATRIINLK